MQAFQVFASSLVALAAPMSGERLRGVNRGVRIDLVADQHCRNNDWTTANPLVGLGPRKPAPGFAASLAALGAPMVGRALGDVHQDRSGHEQK